MPFIEFSDLRGLQVTRLWIEAQAAGYSGSGVSGLWTFIHCKQGTKQRKNIDNPEAGDADCFVGLERHSKLILAWHLGRRTSQHADLFCEKLAEATSDTFQLSTDGWNAYPNAVEYNLGDRVDYAQQVKEFASPGGEEARRYAPPRLIGSARISVVGKPEEARIGTSRVERSNWTIRTHLRRFTRLSNGFSRKRRNLRCAFAIYAAYYNLVKSHASIRMPPAVKAGVTRKPWTMGDLLDAVAA